MKQQVHVYNTNHQWLGTVEVPTEIPTPIIVFAGLHFAYNSDMQAYLQSTPYKTANLILPNNSLLQVFETI